MDHHVTIVAAVLLILAPFGARAQQSYDGQPPAGERTTPLSFRDRFTAANTTGDGCLTLEQAQRALPAVARQFGQIDVKGGGCVTLVEIRSFQERQNARALPRRFAAANTTNDGCLTQRQADQGLPGIARRFSDIDVKMHGCITLAEVTAFLQRRNAQQQQQPKPGQPAQPPSRSPPSRSQPLSFSNRFSTANTTGDGCLTLSQAEQGMPSVAKNFVQIDTEGRGCLTIDQIRAFWRNHSPKQQEQRVALPKDTPPPPAGY